MADIEAQVRLLAERRVARTAAVPIERVRGVAPSPPAGHNGADSAGTRPFDEPDCRGSVGGRETSGIDSLDDEDTEGENDARRRRRPLVLSATAAAILIVAGIVVVANRDDAANVIIESKDSVPVAPVVDDPLGPVPEQALDEPAVPTVVLSTVSGTAVDSTPPESVSSQVVSSSIGDLQSTVVLPGETEIIQPQVGFPGGFALVSDDGELWISDDAVEWRVVESPFPGRLGGVSEEPPGGEPRRYRMSTTTEDGDREIWLSTDFLTWTLREPLPEAMAAGLGEWITGPELLEIESGLEDWTETPEGATLVPVSFGIDWEALALRFGGDDLRQRVDDGEWIITRLDPATGIVEVYLRGSSDNPNAIEVQPGDWFVPAGVQIRTSISGTVDDWVVELEDVASGEVIGSVTGSLPGLAPEDRPGSSSVLTIDDALETLATGGLGASFLARGDALELVDHPPWLGLPGGGPKFVLTDDWLYAYYDSGAWRSPDGRTWENLDTDHVPTAQRFFEGPGGVLVAATDPGNVEPSSLLRSDDGIDWTPPSQPPVITEDDFTWFSQVVPTESGFLFVAYVYNRPAGPELDVWTSEDGDIWEKVEVEEPFDVSARGTAVPPLFFSSGNGVVITDFETETPTFVLKVEILDAQ